MWGQIGKQPLGGELSQAEMLEVKYTLLDTSGQVDILHNGLRARQSVPAGNVI